MSAVSAIVDLPPIARALGLAASLAFALTLVAIIRRSFASLSWPSTQGFLHTSEIRSVPAAYRHHVFYSYKVGDTNYVSTRIHIGPTLYRDHPDELLEERDAFKPGATTRVYFDPDRPHFAVLEPGPRPAHLILLAVAVATSIALSWRWIVG